MNIFEIFFVCLRSTSTVFLLMITGALCVAQLTDRGKKSLKGLSTIHVFVLLPALLFSRMATNFNLDMLWNGRLTFMMSVAQIVTGLLSTKIANVLQLTPAGYEALVYLVTSSQNAVIYPFTLVAGVRGVPWLNGLPQSFSSGGVDGSGGGSDEDIFTQSQNVAQAYFIVYNILFSASLWSFGHNFIKTESQRQKQQQLANNTDDGTETDISKASTPSPSKRDATLVSAASSATSSTVTTTSPSSQASSPTTQKLTSSTSAKSKSLSSSSTSKSPSSFIDSVKQTLRLFISPPIIASLSGMIVGLIPYTHWLATEGPGISQCVHALWILGDAAIPISMLILGCTLRQSISEHQRSQSTTNQAKESQQNHQEKLSPLTDGQPSTTAVVPTTAAAIAAVTADNENATVSDLTSTTTSKKTTSKPKHVVFCAEDMILYKKRARANIRSRSSDSLTSVAQLSTGSPNSSSRPPVKSPFTPFPIEVPMSRASVLRWASSTPQTAGSFPEVSPPPPSDITSTTSGGDGGDGKEDDSISSSAPHMSLSERLKQTLWDNHNIRFTLVVCGIRFFIMPIVLALFAHVIGLRPEHSPPLPTLPTSLPPSSVSVHSTENLSHHVTFGNSYDNTNSTTTANPLAQVKFSVPGAMVDHPRILALACLFESFTPSAMNAVIICAMYSFKTKEMSFMLLFHYIVSLGTSSLWMSYALWYLAP